MCHVIFARVVVAVVGCRLSTVIVDVDGRCCRLSVVIVNVDGRRRVVNVKGREQWKKSQHICR